MNTTDNRFQNLLQRLDTWEKEPFWQTIRAALHDRIVEAMIDQETDQTTIRKIQESVAFFLEQKKHYRYLLEKGDRLKRQYQTSRFEQIKSDDLQDYIKSCDRFFQELVSRTKQYLKAAPDITESWLYRQFQMLKSVSFRLPRFYPKPRSPRVGRQIEYF